MENPENQENIKKSVETPEAVVIQKQVSTQTEKVLGEEQPNIFKRFWYVFVIFGVIIVSSLVILVYGYQKLSQEKPAPSPTPTPITTPTEEIDEQTSDLEEQGTSDEIEDIEADLGETDLSEIDQELEDIDSELSSP